MDVAITRLEGDAFDAAIPALAEILADCVEGGASVNFVLPFSVDDAEAWWRRVGPSVHDGDRIVLGATLDGNLVGTVTLVPASQQNSPHRAEVAKMLVHRRARGHGIGSALLQAVEAEALAIGRTLLLLDTEEGSDGDRLYRRHGWEPWGAVPGYALTVWGDPATAVFFRKTLGHR